MAGLEVHDVVELVVGHGRFEAGTSGSVLERPREGGVLVELYDRGGYTIDVATLPVEKLTVVKRAD
jgi:hypothetical protein